MKLLEIMQYSKQYLYICTGLFGVGEALLHEFVEDRLPDALASVEDRAVSMLSLNFMLGIPRK